MEEKRNHSNDPSSTQPIDEKGRYQKDPKANKNEEKDEVSSIAVSKSDFSSDDFSDDELLKLGEEVSDEWDDNDLLALGDDISDEWGDEPSGNKRLEFDYANVNFMAMSQEDALKKSDELTKKINGDINSWAHINDDFSKFHDQRIRYACLVALQKVMDDFPKIRGKMKKNLEIKTAVGRSERFITYGECNAQWAIDLQSALIGRLAYKMTDNIDVKMFSHTQGLAPVNASAESFVRQVNSSTDHDHYKNPNTILLHTMFHELGHFVECMIEREHGGYPIEAKNNKEFFRKEGLICSEIKSNIIDVGVKSQQGKDKKFFSEDTSDYGKSNSSEWFAETFASMYSSEPRASALAMREYLKEVFV